MATAKYKYVNGKLVLVEGEDILKDYNKGKDPVKVYKDAVKKLKNNWLSVYARALFLQNEYEIGEKKWTTMFTIIYKKTKGLQFYTLTVLKK